MTDGLVTLLATGCSVLGSIITAFIVRNGQKESDTRKANRESRIALYKEVYQGLERLRINRELIFDEWYEKYLVKFLPEIKLLASEEAREAFLALGDFVHRQGYEYRNYYKAHDPRNDPCFFDEDGEPAYVPEELELAFESEMQTYRRQQMPDAETVNAVVSAVCDAMRNDLGITEEI